MAAAARNVMVEIDLQPDEGGLRHTRQVGLGRLLPRQLRSATTVIYKSIPLPEGTKVMALFGYHQMFQ